MQSPHQRLVTIIGSDNGSALSLGSHEKTLCPWQRLRRPEEKHSPAGPLAPRLPWKAFGEALEQFTLLFVINSPS